MVSQAKGGESLEAEGGQRGLKRGGDLHRGKKLLTSASLGTDQGDGEVEEHPLGACKWIGKNS